jgi:indole-3-glycerol phosphate synthase
MVAVLVVREQPILAAMEVLAAAVLVWAQVVMPKVQEIKVVMEELEMPVLVLVQAVEDTLKLEKIPGQVILEMVEMVHLTQ